MGCKTRCEPRWRPCPCGSPGAVAEFHVGRSIGRTLRRAMCGREAWGRRAASAAPKTLGPDPRPSSRFPRRPDQHLTSCAHSSPVQPHPRAARRLAAARRARQRSPSHSVLGAAHRGVRGRTPLARAGWGGRAGLGAVLHRLCWAPGSLPVDAARFRANVIIRKRQRKKVAKRTRRVTSRPVQHHPVPPSCR